MSRRVLAALLLLAGTEAGAQEPAPATPAPAEPPAQEVKEDTKATPSAGSERVFRPSEEVSPDQEVDFPADL